MAKFSVGVRIKKSLLEKLHEIDNGEIDSLYGSAAGFRMLPSARESSRLEVITFEDLKRFIKDVHDCGYKFSYTINVKCLGSDYTKNDIISYLTQLDSAEVDAVIVANLFILKLIAENRHRLGFNVKISTIFEPNSLLDIKFFRRFNPETISLSLMKNRDFEFLKNISPKNDIELLVNEVCLFECPWRTEHYCIQGHGGNEKLYGKYPYSECYKMCLENPSLFLKARWIRPEDISFYERLGFSKFKITGRTASGDWIVATTKAYLNRSYEGNLLDLFPIVAGDLKREANEAPIYIPNKKLDGFLERFPKHKCEDVCGVKCHFCDEEFKKIFKR